ncbi:MAG TPA: hypothetical protein VNE42_00525 [Acidimicrobiales bacterium]|nr:hypothetical protein [Acidimicrobiales bacterium]
MVSHRAAAAFFAIDDRCSGVSLAARVLLPLKAALTSQLNSCGVLAFTGVNDWLVGGPRVVDEAPLHDDPRQAVCLIGCAQ